MTSHPAERLAKYVMGLYGPPAFAQRENRVQTAWTGILEKCRSTRTESLRGVRWALKSCGDKLKLTLDADVEIALEQIRTATAEKKLSQFPIGWRMELYSLAGAIDRFNDKWMKFLRSIDFGPINELRKEFNQNFVIEKECATGAEQIARQGFSPYSPMGLDALSQEFPLLKPMPRFLRPYYSASILVPIVYVAMLFFNITLGLLSPSTDIGNRVPTIILLWGVFFVFVVTLYGYRRKLRELEDELDRRSQ